VTKKGTLPCALLAPARRRAPQRASTRATPPPVPSIDGGGYSQPESGVNQALLVKLVTSNVQKVLSSSRSPFAWAMK
jgi:hypothetical protein